MQHHQKHIHCEPVLKRPSLTPLFSYLGKRQAEELGISLGKLYETRVTDLVAPWDVFPVTCVLYFAELDKINAPREITLEHFLL